MGCREVDRGSERYEERGPRALMAEGRRQARNDVSMHGLLEEENKGKILVDRGFVEWSFVLTTFGCHGLAEGGSSGLVIFSFVFIY